MNTKTINYLHMKKNRGKCVLCGNNTINLFTINMPVFMGVNLNNKEEHLNGMSFNVCNVCGEVQIDELLDLSILYQNNHNINVVGNIWKQHYVELVSFISDTIKDKVILEISDPSAKIAKLSEGFKQWYIIEPNVEKNDIENVEFIDGFFDNDFNVVSNVDVIIHSHLLEHIHDPIVFFKKCNELLKEDGVMVISVPDMDYILNKEHSPNNILHFEHTYFLNYKVLELLSSLNGFKIVDSKSYDNHSIFYKLKKDSNVKPKIIKLNIEKQFVNNFNKHKENINSINQKLKEYCDFNVYLFGGHVSSQFYLFNGLEKTNIKYIIDNDINKHDNKLYGVDLFIKDPKIVAGDDKCVVICSHVGIYRDEIVKQLTEFNKNVIIL
jgi:SAM-dependent methyltransferase